MVETQAQQAQQQGRIIRPKDAAKLLSISKATLYRWEKEGRLAKRITLSPGVSGWRESDLIAFIEQAEKGEGK